ncbi:MAG: LacI family DNA-binding transcriptional regulator [Devosiaceae bacterium]|nr:LacI family DNA-binding transcriptional regulator [Devosiaceae bacterium]
MTKDKISTKGSPDKASGPKKSVTIKDLAAELDLSITTISRALNGYDDVGAKTRERVREAAKKHGYRPNRNAQRLVAQRTHNIAWIQSDNDQKFVDPHFVEVMAGVLRGARIGNYDIVLTSDTTEHQIAVYDRYVRDNSVDGFIVDLPQHNDPRIKYLLDANKPFIAHSRDNRSDEYSWVDTDNHGIYKKLTKLLIANGHRHIAFLNGDAKFTFASARQLGVSEALEELDMDPATVKTFNATHPMANAGYQLTKQALADGEVSAILYSSALMAVEGYGALVQAGRQPGKNISIATMDDMLNYLDLSPYEGIFTFVRSSLREAGEQLVRGLIEQCENKSVRSQTIIPSRFFIGNDLINQDLQETS